MKETVSLKSQVEIFDKEIKKLRVNKASREKELVQELLRLKKSLAQKENREANGTVEN